MEDEESEDWGRWEDEEDMDMVSPVVVGTSLNVHDGSVPVKTVEEGQEKPVHSELGRCDATSVHQDLQKGVPVL
jgi:hypothetical protein